MVRLNMTALATLLCLAWLAPAAQAQTLPINGFGNGAYTPDIDLSGGTYEGLGLSTVLGFTSFTGTTQIVGVDPDNPNILFWQNRGQGTSEEVFQVNRTFLGKLNARVSGQVELIPLNDEGLFTAVWEGRFEFVGGTGLFRRASGFADVTAVNLPFTLGVDPVWDFLWTWNGRIRLR